MKKQRVARPEKNTSSKEQRAARQDVTEEAQQPIEEGQDHNNVAAGQGADEERWRQDIDTPAGSLDPKAAMVRLNR